ncbi:MAG: zinc-ribbon domain-containing protein [Anaerolineae bacterium]|nr:zinc-ribbon domain-containing protein [Anaerolineae bacterium]NIN95993.1 zinc-ribbon domain-containing protein [Anaerolineae bacterium]NIQ79025.1 zinc-ribbon domain-containing protein [Anaerolineae bacterium]
MSPPFGAIDRNDSSVDNSHFETGVQDLEHVASLPTCSECGSRNREGGRFCGQCGAPLAEYCPQCGSKIPASVGFCERCGTEHGQAAAFEGKCQRCGTQNEKNAEFCKECGGRLLVVCPRCDAVMGTSANFCARCGFNYSQFVTGRLTGKPEEETDRDQGKDLSYFNIVSNAVMIALVILSIVLIIYILAQI